MIYWDSSFIILIPALLVAAWAQYRVSSTFNKYSKYKSLNGYTGAQVARMLLDSSGLYDVPVELIPGKLSDHYDPGKRVMRLSQEVYHGNSVASIGVAAHETGHAIQHKNGYLPLIIRNSIVPAVNFGSNTSWILLIAGFILGIRSLVTIGIFLFTLVVLFQIITLPVELNASSRALKILEGKSILYSNELSGARSVLRAAAMTYVAAVLTAVANLLRLIYISRDRN
ncbi:zinc metallopeptidase [Clostridium sp.]|uniref:zinc metallopeptidase n=1 Tax=Clostridium sp. TaxID=1506 RepID=UPI002FDD92B4